MRKISVLPVILLIVVFFAGCTTSQVSHLPAVAGQKSSTGREVVANLKGSNNGLFLFYYIPLWSGSVTRPNRRNYECFENQLRPKYLMRMLNARAEKLEGGRETPEELLESLDKELPILVMDHQPRELSELSLAGADLQLSGHTHNGQLFPGNLLVALLYDNAYGLKKEGNMYSVVTSGVGVWGPGMRVGTDSEIVLINLEFNGKDT